MENPYSAPQSPKHERLPPRLHARDMAFILFFSAIAGILVGVITNTLNGCVAMDYFLRYRPFFSFSSSWINIIFQGAIEGFLYGIANGVLYLVLLSVISQRRCTITQAKVFLAWAVGIALVVWLIFGLISRFGVAYQPRYYGDFFNFHLDGASDGYGWATNCIRGIKHFSPVITFLAAIGCIIKYRLEWKASENSEQIHRSGAPIQR